MGWEDSKVLKPHSVPLGFSQIQQTEWAVSDHFHGVQQIQGNHWTAVVFTEKARRLRDDPEDQRCQKIVLAEEIAECLDVIALPTAGGMSRDQVRETVQLVSQQWNTAAGVDQGRHRWKFQ